MIYGVWLGDKHCYDDYGMLLAQKNIGFPDVQTNMIEVLGRNGLLDLTESMSGGPKYYNREIGLTFITSDKLSGMAWSELISAVACGIHGQQIKIVFDEDEDYYYLGRCRINQFTTSRAKRTIEIICDCDPFKYKTEETTTTVSLTANVEQTITLTNEYMTATPTIVVDGGEDVNVTIVCGTSSAVFGSGSYLSSALALPEGETEWTVSADEACTVTISYQEGTL